MTRGFQSRPQMGLENFRFGVFDPELQRPGAPARRGARRDGFPSGRARARGALTASAGLQRESRRVRNLRVQRAPVPRTSAHGRDAERAVAPP